MDSIQKSADGDNPASQLQLTVPLGLPCELKVVCRSSSRNSTSFEIFDNLGDSMGQRDFSSRGIEGPILERFIRSLIEDLNVLLEEFDVQVNFLNLLPVAKLAVHKCESLYGLGAEDGDCIITLQ